MQVLPLPPHCRVFLPKEREVFSFCVVSMSHPVYKTKEFGVGLYSGLKRGFAKASSKTATSGSWNIGSLQAINVDHWSVENYELLDLRCSRPRYVVSRFWSNQSAPWSLDKLGGERQQDTAGYSKRSVDGKEPWLCIILPNLSVCFRWVPFQLPALPEPLILSCPRAKARKM